MQSKCLTGNYGFRDVIGFNSRLECGVMVRADCASDALVSSRQMGEPKSALPTLCSVKT
jgi:hypothetical protein